MKSTSVDTGWDAPRVANPIGYAWTCWVLAGLALVAAFVIAIGVRRTLRYRNRAAVSAIRD